MEIFAEKGYKAENASKLAEELTPVLIGKYSEVMLLKHIPAKPPVGLPILER